MCVADVCACVLLMCVHVCADAFVRVYIYVLACLYLYPGVGVHACMRVCVCARECLPPSPPRRPIACPVLPLLLLVCEGVWVCEYAYMDV